MELELSINGVITGLEVAPNESLLTLLRREGYYSVKHGCETGECGACTVLVDGTPRPSCVMFAAQAGGCSLATVESLGSAAKLHPLQAAFVEIGAVQCGFCMPGMLLSASALLKNNPSPSEDEVRDALSGNLCRCTGYVKPVQAVMRAAAVMRGETVAPLEYKVIGSSDEREESTGKSRIVTYSRAPGTGARIKTVTSATAASIAGATTTKIPVLPLSGVSNSSYVQLSASGNAVPAINAVKHTTGKAVFSSDVHLRGLLYGRVLTSPHAHAVIRDIDVSQARALPGVHVVLTYKDVPRIPFSSVEQTHSGQGLQDQYCLDYIVRYVGDRVAVVAAETPEVAEQALGLITVEYDVLSPILAPRQALAADAPILHPESESRGIYDASRNVAARVRSEVGDVERGFALSDLVVEEEYIVFPSQPTPLENHTVVTFFDDDDRLVVRSSTQVPHHVRRTLSHLFGLPARRIHVVKPEVGGSFGMKQEVVLEDLCALLTIFAKRPVLLEYSRAEELRSSRARQQHILRVKTGVKQDGTIVANQMIVLASTGAYGTHPLTYPAQAASGALSLYPSPNMRYIAEILYTNHVPSGAFRGYGLPQEFFALECHIDEIARQLDIDPLELRRKNWIGPGQELPLTKDMRPNKEGAIIESCGLPACLSVVETKLRWSEKRGKASDGRYRRGVGIALSLHGEPGITAETSGAMIKLNEDGSFDLFVGANDDGGTGSDTIIAQITAEALGVSIDDILLHASSTDSSPFETSVSVSSALYIKGGAVKKAAEQMRRQILSVAGRMLNILPEALKLNKGTISAPGGQTITVAQVAAHSLFAENRHIMTTASWRALQVPTTFAAQGVEVEVDVETGSVRVLKAISAVDAGHTINPMIAEAQMQGAATQALGASICEELIYDQKGALLTDNFADYRIYAAPDMPDLDTFLVETIDPSGPFGAKAVAAIPLYGMAPAIANAVADAAGVAIRHLPLTPERVLRAVYALREKRS